MTNITDIDKCKCSAISSKKKALKTLLYIFKRVMTSPLFNEDDIVKDIIVQSNRHFESLLLFNNLVRFISIADRKKTFFLKKKEVFVDYFKLYVLVFIMQQQYLIQIYNKDLYYLSIEKREVKYKCTSF
ncbi:uncharacterized protein BX663DRAFT_541378 [Cokeromyces recurvatus]|uniref:uncharacterized protein n=1 Tax=Cokeromyces recurvatus TaxID=90255 RepID=UPI0022208F42|nr:uncharacterized protein BX663DRAFT_541378 [Cokeromyces recurvatus]KAI7905140.1 hypothetical protein BX663DRAFT_541378 [Cokeromyces recurvatus]